MMVKEDKKFEEEYEKSHADGKFLIYTITAEESI